MPHIVERPGVLKGAGLALFLALVHMVNDAVTAIVGALLPTLQARFGLGATTIASLVAVYSIASSLTQPYFGALAETRGPRLVGAVGTLAAALFLGLVGAAPTVWGVFVLLALGGLGSAALHPVGTTIAGAPSVENRAAGVGLFTTGGMVGFAIGPIVILWLVQRFGAAATVWLVVPGAILAALVWHLLPVWQPHDRVPLADRVGFRVLRGPLGLLTLAGTLIGVAFLTFTGSIPIWLVQQHGFATDSSRIAWALAVFGLAAGIGAIGGGILVARFERRTVFIGSVVAAPISFLAILVTPPESPWFLAATAGAGLILYLGSSVKIVMAQDAVPDRPASAAGVVMGMSGALSGLAYVLIGVTQQTLGLVPGMVIGFAMPLAAAPVLVATFRRHPELR